MTAVNQKLIVALDVDSIALARKLLRKLHKKVKIFKVGPSLFARYGPDIIRLVHNFNCKVFLDLKLHDIPNTVASAVRQLTRLKIYMFTIHIQGGIKMMKDAACAAKDEAKKLDISKPIVLGVTVLSSFGKKDLEAMNIRTEVEVQVVHLARLAKRSKLDGVVTSAKEVRYVKKAVGKNFIVVCAGIRPKGTSVNDQKRVKTPKEAIEEGADYIVVGRPIIKSQRPLQTTEGILKEISEN